MTRITHLYVNGARRAIDADSETSLLEVLRDQLDLTGAKYGCGESRCGACTVLINGFPRHSCVTRVGRVGDTPVTTIEGLERDGRLHPLQQAFLDAGAMQCAFCTSGMIVTASALLRANANPSEEEIARFLEGNLCRCGTYPRIIAAVRQAATAQRGAGR